MKKIICILLILISIPILAVTTKIQMKKVYVVKCIFGYKYYVWHFTGIPVLVNGNMVSCYNPEDNY